MTLYALQVKDSYRALLSTGSGGLYRVLGYEKQSKSAGTINNIPLVQTIYENGEFKGGKGPKNHDVKLTILISVAGSATADLVTMNDEMATPTERAEALLNAKEADSNASDLLEAVWSKVWEITNDARNYYLGMPKGTVANTKLSTFNRGEPIQEGGYVVLTAVAQLEYRVNEPVAGYDGYEPDNAIYENRLNPSADTVNHEPDTVQKSGVKVTTNT